MHLIYGPHVRRIATPVEKSIAHLAFGSADTGAVDSRTAGSKMGGWGRREEDVEAAPAEGAKPDQERRTGSASPRVRRLQKISRSKYAYRRAI